MRLDPIPVSIQMERIAAQVENLKSVLCLECRVALSWYQPDPRVPDRLLGTCLKCGRCQVLQIRPKTHDALIYVVPTTEHPDDCSSA